MARSAVIAALSMLGAACADRDTAPAESIQELRFEQVSNDPVEHGERLSQVLGCSGCHREDLTGLDWSEPDYGVLWTSNLTHSAKSSSDEELIKMIVEGRRPDRPLHEMPSFLFTQLHREDLGAIVAYVRSKPKSGDVRPEPTFGPALLAEIASGEYKNSRERVVGDGNVRLPDMGETNALGRHIVRATCTECHGLDLRGGEEPMSVAGAPPPDLRMVASYDPDAFASFMRIGAAPGGRELDVMSDLARNRYSLLTETELEAIRTYLVELAKRDP